MTKKLFIPVVLWLIITMPNCFADVSYFLFDGPGKSVTSLVNTPQAVVNTYEYDSFGNITSQTEGVSNSYKYNGEQNDSATGLIFLRNRNYDTVSGRFITKDIYPEDTKTPQTLNPYVYVGNNAINFVDPLGLFSLWKAGKSVGGILVNGVGVAVGLTSEAVPGADIPGTLLLANSGVGVAADSINLFKNITGQDDELPSTSAIGLAVYYGAQALGTSGPQLKLVTAVGDLADSILSLGLGVASLRSAASDYNTLSSVIQSTPKLAPAVLSSIPSDLELSDASLSVFTGVSGFVSALGSSTAAYNAPLPTNSFGGVDLNLTATLLGNVQDFGGATYDQATGQIILYGQQNTTLPPMDLDDLSVAVDSEYGLNGVAPADPGVSIGTQPSSVAGQMYVGYFGAVMNTGFGATLFQADRLLKTLIMGKDNITGAPVSASVPGYENMPNRYKAAGYAGYTAAQSNPIDRMWFTPQQMTLALSTDGSAMEFSQAKMQLLTSATLNGITPTDPYAEAFATEVTNDYNLYANEFPILQQLTRLGKITAVVKWIKDNNIPFDLSFFSNYVPAAGSTPQYTPQTTVLTAWELSSRIFELTITGGVIYTLDASNFATSTDTTTTAPSSAAGQAAVNARPSENNFSWNFNAQDPSGNTNQYTAIAQSMTRAQKDGSLKFQATDLSFPVEGNNPLVLVRYYNSFYDKTSGFGLGWQLTPYSLRFPATPESYTFNNAAITLTANYQIYLRDGQSEYLYTLQGLNSSNKPVYLREGGSNYLVDNQDGTFQYYKFNQGTVSFGSQGQVTQVVDQNGIAINYNYNSSLQLTSIVHQDGRSIVLNYTGNNITSATGLSSKTVNYTYYSNGQLNTVVDEANDTTTYYYDANLHLNKIVDPRTNTSYQATFDDYNRATAQTVGSAQYSQEFDLTDRMTTTTNPYNVLSTQLFDENYNLSQNQDFLDNTTSIVYDPTDFGPDSVTDANGNITQYLYDSLGDVWYTQDANGGQRFYFYDQNRNLIATRDELGNDTAYIYDGNNRLIQVFTSVTLNYTSPAVPTTPPSSLNYSYDPDYSSTYTYDSNGNVLSATDPQGRTVNTTYDVNGMPLTVSFPSGYQTIKQYDSFSRLQSVSDPAGDITTFGYDNVDRVTSIQTAAGTTTYSYDANGNVSTVQDGNINQTKYTYDGNNNLVTVTDAAQGMTKYTYDTTNKLTQVIMPNGSIKQIMYDEASRPDMEISTISNPAPHIAEIVNSINFGTVMMGAPNTAQLTVYNVGDAPLSINSISIDNPIFTVNPQTATIPEGGQETFNVTFTPTASGTATGNLTINSNDSITPAIIIPLSGNGLQGVAIINQPANETVTAPATATFTIVTTGSNLTYQWKYSTDGGATYADVTTGSGATGTSYTTAATTIANNGTLYECVVSNFIGSITSSAAALTVNSAPAAPAITAQPVSETVAQPATATFTVAATGAATLMYQWSSCASNCNIANNWQAINGAIGASYTTPATTTAESGTQYRCVVTNSAGNVTSNAATLTVTLIPVAPVLKTATAGNGQVTLAWGTDTGATNYTVAYGTTSGVYNTTVNAGNATSYTVSGLTNGTTYNFVVTATSAGGTSSNSNQLSAIPLPPPVAPVLNTAVRGNAQVTLTWSSVAGAASYNVAYGTSSGSYGAAVNAGNGTTFTVTGLTNGTTYYFVVSATNSAGTSPYSNPLSAAPSVLPPAPSIYNVSNGNGAVTIYWTNYSSATSFKISIGTSSGNYNYGSVNITPGTYPSGNYDFDIGSGLAVGTTYYIVITATNSFGSSPNSNEVSVTPVSTPPVPYPINLSYTFNASQSQVTFSWGTETATSFNIKRSSVSGGPYTIIANTTGLSYTDTTVNNGNSYYYVLSAVNSSGQSPNSPEYAVTFPSPPSVLNTAVAGAVTFMLIG